jgi:hypothetical protein
MTTTFSRLSSKWLAVALLTFTTPFATEGQRRGPQQPAAAPWPSITIGVKAGYDSNTNAEVLGAQIRIPLLRSGTVELIPHTDVTFATALKEYQYAVDAVYLLSGRRGGLYVGGGLAFRNTIYGSDPKVPRKTSQGYSVVVGTKFGGGGGLGAQLELRWVFISESGLDDVSSVDPQVVTFGVNIPLTGRGSRQERPDS